MYARIHGGVPSASPLFSPLTLTSLATHTSVAQLGSVQMYASNYDTPQPPYLAEEEAGAAGRAAAAGVVALEEKRKRAAKTKTPAMMVKAAV